jgi:3-oxoacyl-[acyl-carrier-protein] synthase-3
MTKRSKIAGTGSCVPERVLTNRDLESMIDTSDEWITTRTGIRQRHIAAPGENNSDLAIGASRAALEMAGIGASEIDLIIVGTLTPDMPMPSVACLVQKELGANSAGAFDVSATCSGFLYSLSIADKFIKDDPSMKILAIGSEVLSRRTNWEDRTTCVLFADGAGAAVVTGSEDDSGILSTCLHADGSVWDLLTIKGLGTAYPVDQELLSKGWQYIEMKGKDVFKHAVRALESVAQESMAKAGWNNDDLDLLIAHQANIRILDFLRERLKLPREKVFINIDKYGNTSAASIPIALDEACRSGRLKKGDNVLMISFGGGFTWAGVTMRW